MLYLYRKLGPRCDHHSVWVVRTTHSSILSSFCSCTMWIQCSTGFRHKEPSRFLHSDLSLVWQYGSVPFSDFLAKTSGVKTLHCLFVIHTFIFHVLQYYVMSVIKEGTVALSMMAQLVACLPRVQVTSVQLQVRLFLITVAISSIFKSLNLYIFFLLYSIMVIREVQLVFWHERL